MAQLQQRAGQIVDPVQGEAAGDEIEAAGAKGRASRSTSKRLAACRRRLGCDRSRCRRRAAARRRSGSRESRSSARAKGRLISASRSAAARRLRERGNPPRRPAAAARARWRRSARAVENRDRVRRVRVEPAWKPIWHAALAPSPAAGRQSRRCSLLPRPPGCAARATGLLDLLLPPRCLKCGVPVAATGTLCAACWRGITFLGAPCCACCGLPFDFDAGPGGAVRRLLADAPPFDRARARRCAMTMPAAALILAFKHGDRLHLAPALAHGCGAPAPSSSPRPTCNCRCRCIGRGFSRAATTRRRCWRMRSPSGRPAGRGRLSAAPPPHPLSRHNAMRSARRRNVAGAFAINAAGKIARQARSADRRRADHRRDGRGMRAGAEARRRGAGRCADPGARGARRNLMGARDRPDAARDERSEDMAKVEIYSTMLCGYCARARGAAGAQRASLSRISTCRGRRSQRDEMVERAGGRTTRAANLHRRRAYRRLGRARRARSRGQARPAAGHRARDDASPPPASSSMPAARSSPISAPRRELVRRARDAGADLIMTPEVSDMIEPRRALRAGEGARRSRASDARRVPRSGARDRRASAARLDRGARWKAMERLAQPLLPHRARRRRSSRATTRSTCSMSICRAARAIANRRRSGRARAAALAALPWGMLGLTVCYDLRFPHLYRALAQGGADFLTVPVGLHRADRPGALACAAAGAGDREWLLRLRPGAMRRACRGPQAPTATA